MLPYLNQNRSGSVLGADNSNQMAAMNIRNFRLTEKTSNFGSPGMQVAETSNFAGPRSVACCPSPMTNLSMNNRQSSEGIMSSHRPGSAYQIQPNSGFVSQWQNQQMTIGVMSVPIGQNIPSSSFQQNKTVQLISREEELGVMEKQMYQSGQVFQHEITSTVPKKRNFQFALPSEAAASEKTNLKKASTNKDDPPDFRHFTGSVEQVIHWYQVVKSFDVVPIFEVHGVLESIHLKTRQNIVVLMIKQASGGPSLQGIFCAIDRPFPQSLQPGDNIVCVGKMKGAKKMQVLNAWRETAKQEDYTRISFLCQRAVQEFISSTSEP